MAQQDKAIQDGTNKIKNSFENVKDFQTTASTSLNGAKDAATTSFKDTFGDVQQRASELYDISSDWVQENRLITTVSLAAAAGVVGFFLGRSARPSKTGIQSKSA